VSATPSGGGAQEARSRECSACRGTGKVSSSLGGEPHEVTCPWCGGTGEFQPGRDAQAGPPANAGR
jgi:DnaJ-class molecular chaperone